MYSRHTLFLKFAGAHNINTVLTLRSTHTQFTLGMRHHVCLGYGGLVTALVTGGIFLVIYINYADFKDGNPTYNYLIHTLLILVNVIYL